MSTPAFNQPRPLLDMGLEKCAMARRLELRQRLCRPVPSAVQPIAEQFARRVARAPADPRVARAPQNERLPAQARKVPSSSEKEIDIDADGRARMRRLMRARDLEREDARRARRPASRHRARCPNASRASSAAVASGARP